MKKLVAENFSEFKILNEDFISKDTTLYLNTLFKPYKIKVIKDFEEPGENYDYENNKAYAQYSFEGHNSKDLSLEILIDFDDNKTFQFWYDARPILFGNLQTLVPDHQPFEKIDIYIPDVINYINNAV